MTRTLIVKPYSCAHCKNVHFVRPVDLLWHLRHHWLKYSYLTGVVVAPVVNGVSNGHDDGNSSSDESAYCSGEDDADNEDSDARKSSIQQHVTVERRSSSILVKYGRH